MFLNRNLYNNITIYDIIRLIKNMEFFMGTRKAINTTIDSDLMKKIKLLALEKECKINDLIEEGLRMVLEKEGKK